MDNNKNAVHLENEQTEQDMDESDSPSPMGQQTTAARVFCCGETPRAATKLLLSRSGPGQAVQVITVQDKGNGISDSHEVRITNLLILEAN